MTYLKSLVLTACVCPIMLNAQNFLTNGDAESDLDGWTVGQVELVTENPHDGKNCFKTITQAYNLELIPIDVTKTYKISGWFKSADDKKTNLYLGIVPYDADKKQIQYAFVGVIPGSEAELAEACKAEDTVLKVKDASKWVINNKINQVAFGTDNSGAYKDLPNSKLSPVVAKAEKKGNCWEVTLTKPCGLAYPANTTIRLQTAGGWQYPLIATKFQSPEWKELSGLIKGVSTSGAHHTQFWPGTKYVHILVFALEGGMLYFDDLKFEAVK